MAVGGSDARAWREENRGWEMCGEVRGWCSPFIGVRGAPGRTGAGGFGLRGQQGQRDGWAKGRVGHKVGRAESEEKKILN
jgi:hypothetical protein